MKHRRLKLGKETLRALQPKDLGRAAGATPPDIVIPTPGISAQKICVHPFTQQGNCGQGTFRGTCLVSLECPTRFLRCGTGDDGPF